MEKKHQAFDEIIIIVVNASRENKTGAGFDYIKQLLLDTLYNHLNQQLILEKNSNPHEHIKNWIKDPTFSSIEMKQQLVSELGLLRAKETQKHTDFFATPHKIDQHEQKESAHKTPGKSSR